jgi:hypothetical protein
VLALEEQVRTAPRGVVMSWPDLKGLVEQLTQVIDGTFIACRTESDVAATPETGWQDLHRKHDFAVTADDSTFWWVTAPEAVVARVRAQFPHTEEHAVY